MHLLGSQQLMIFKAVFRVAMWCIHVVVSAVAFFSHFSSQIILPSAKDNNATEIAAAFDAVNEAEGGMCAMIHTGFVASSFSRMSLSQL
jgi:hypothetical protein